MANTEVASTSTSSKDDDCVWIELDHLLARARDQGWAVDVDKECTLERVLGKGSGGEARLARWRGALCVVKLVKPIDALARMAFIRECSIMARLRHPNVLSFYGFGVDAEEKKCAIVCEYANGGTLKAWLYGRKRQPLRARLEVALGIARGMDYLSSRNVLHRDLKPSNVFMKGDLPVIADFGLARFFAADGEELTGETGTYIYMAPEVIKSQHYDSRADVYSFGVLLCELVTGTEPFQPHNSTGIQIATAVADKGFRPKISDDVHAGMRAIIEMCWQQDANSRPHFAQVLESLEHMVPDIVREEEAKLAAQKESPSFQTKALNNLSSTFADWSNKMSELAKPS